MKTDISLLTTLGFSEKAARIYMALLRQSPQHRTSISRITGIRRASLDTPLKTLEKGGLVHRSPSGKRTVFYAEDPTKLSFLWEQRMSEAHALIKDLHAHYTDHTTPHITLLRGTEGYRRLFDDIAARLKRGDVFYRYSARRLDERRFRISPAYKKARQNKHLTRYVITGEAKGRTKRPRLDRFVKTIPASFDLFQDNVSQIIYEHRVALIDHENDTTIIITSAPLATFQKKLFRLLWHFLDSPPTAK